jgi:hypothetical protein
MNIFFSVEHMKAGRLQREKVIINANGDTAEQLDNTGGHQAYLDYLARNQADSLQQENKFKDESK